MKIAKQITIAILVLIVFQGCGIYSFSGISISPETKTFQVNFFQNQAPRVTPGIDQTFTNQLQDLIQNQQDWQKLQKYLHNLCRLQTHKHLN